MKKILLIGVVILFSFTGVNHSQAGVYNFWTAGGTQAPEMYFNFNINPYVDSSSVSGGASGSLSDIIGISDVQVDTNSFTAVVGHYDAGLFSYSYSGQIVSSQTWVQIDPWDPGHWEYEYLPYTLQFQTVTNSHDSTDVYNIDPMTLTFNWDSTVSESVVFSGLINVDGNISNFNFSRSISWSGSGSFDNTYYPKGLILDLERTSSGMASETIFAQTINGKLINFDLDPNQFALNSTVFSGTLPSSIVPEPISSTLFIVGGATLGFSRFRKKFKK